MIVALAVAAVILISSGTGRQDVAGSQTPQEPGTQEPSTQEPGAQEPTSQDAAGAETAPENESEPASATPEENDEPSPDGELGSPALGSEDAPVVLVEYSDYQ